MKIFASDYDGTLFKNKEITDYDLKMIKEFRVQGNKFGIATGRTVNSITHELEKYDIPYDFIVGINGGVVLSQEGEELYLSNFNEEILPEVMETLVEDKVLYYGINDGYGLSRIAVVEEFPDHRSNIGFMDYDRLMANGVKGMYVRHASSYDASNLANKINELYNSAGIYSFPNNKSIDIGSLGVTKSTGIELILNHFKLLNKTKVFTIGDAENDEPMINDYHGFAMDNGVEDIKEKSQDVVSSVGEALKIAMTL